MTRASSDTYRRGCPMRCLAFDVSREMRVGGVDFAILEDRKFKTGPYGLIPQMGPRPDHVRDPSYDPQAIDVPEAQLLGKRQLKFLEAWAQDWRGAEMKAVLEREQKLGAR